MIIVMSTKHLIILILCILGCASSAYMSFRIMQEKTSRGQMLFVLLMSGSLVMNMGTFIEVSTINIDTMLTAVKIGYVGRIFLCLLMPAFLAEYFHNPIPMWIKWIYWIINSFYIVVIMSIGYNSLYYKVYGAKFSGSFPQLVKTPGPLYYPFIVEICMIMSYMVFLTSRVMWRNRNGSDRMKYIYMTIGSLLPALEVAIYQTHKVFEFDCISMVMSCSGIMFYCAIRKYHLFDLEQNAKDYVLDNASEAVLVLDTDERVLYYNQPFGDMFLQFELYSQIPRELVSGWNPHNTNEISKGDNVYELHRAELYRRDGKLEGYLIELKDITEEKKDMEKMNLLTKAAESANQKKSDFLANMSHEIRTPINAILGMDEMILREGQEKNIIDYAESIQSSGKSLLYLINDILDYSKLESGKMQIIAVEYSIREMAKSMNIELQGRNYALPVKVRAELDPNMPVGLLGDELRIKQLLTNVYTNALKYCHRERLYLNMTYRTTQESFQTYTKVYLVILIRETGKITRQIARNVLFDRAQKNMNDLSIAIVNQLVDLMQAEIKILEAEDQDGMDILIPQGLVDMSPVGQGIYFDSEEEIVTEKKKEEVFLAPGKEVLVVDDNAVNLKVMVGLLKRTKVSVSTAKSGVECLQLVQEKKYDLIFMDHLMPEMDGIETLQNMRKLSDCLNVDTPVIALTANAIAGAREMYLEKGFTDYLMKPVRGNELEQMMSYFFAKET